MIPGSATPFLLAKSDAGYQISRSLRFNDGDSPSLSRNFSSAGNRKKWTWSGWFKVASTSQPGRLFSAGADATNRTNIFYYPRSNNLGIGFYSYVGGALVGQAGTTAVLADHSAWYHLVFAFDAANSTTADRLKIYINGVEQAISYTVNVSDIDHLVSNNIAHYVGRGADGYSFDGYLAEVHFIDGQALAATDFGEYDDNNVWQPKEYSGQYNEPIDQSQNWTNLVTFNAGTWNGNGTNPFNADPTDYDYGDTTRENNGYATLDLSSFSGAKVISVTAEQTELTLTHDGGTTVYTPPNTSRTTHTFASVDNPTSLKFDGLNSNSQFVLVGVSVDGKRLVNSNITVANNGFHLDFSDNSSNAALGYDANGTVRYYPDVTGTGISSTVKKLFDGNIATTVDGTAGTVITFTPSTSIAYSSSVEVYTASSQTTRTYSLNGGTGVTNVANGWTSLATGSGTITSISQTPNSGYTHSWSAIRVDGVFLTDPNDWTVNNLAAAAPVPVYSSTHGSNITSSELAKLLDGDDSTYATASGDLIGFSYSGNSITMKVGNTDTNNPELSFIIQPFVNNIQTQSGTWSNVSVGSVASNTNFWNIPGNSTGTGTFTFPATWDGNFRIYLGGWSSAFRMYSLDTAPAEGAGIDSLIDTPTNYEAAVGNNGGNYATLNPLAVKASTGLTFSQGNLRVAGTSNHDSCHATFAVSTGKWYWEVLIDSAIASTYYPSVGAIDVTDTAIINGAQPGDSQGGICYMANGQKFEGGSLSSYGSSYVQGDIIGFALDMDAGTLVAYKNGQPQGTLKSGITGTWTVSHSVYSSALTYNFGQRPFAISSIPTGYKSLCTQNFDPPTIADGSTAFDIITYSGDGTSSRNLTLPLAADLVWIKKRSAVTSHHLADTVRGDDAVLKSNSTDEEKNPQTEFSGGGISSISNTTVTIKEGTSNNDNQNALNATYVGWLWDAGTSTGSNNNGSIISSVRANPSAGFSIVSYTGNNGSSGTIGHGLNAAPSMFIVKNRGTTTDDWIVYHKSLGATKRIKLNSTAAADTNSSQFNDTEPTSSVFTVGSLQNINDNYNYIAYCFAPVAGYSAFGSYTGNGSTDGPFVFTNFRPALVICKPTTTTGSWQINDSARNTFNVADEQLFANESIAATTTTNRYIDFLSNGFKVRGDNLSFNGSGHTYVYLAFAENPFKTARAR